MSFGLVLGNLAFLAVSTTMDPAAVQTWGWRIPFWAGGLLVVVGLLVRFGLAETPDFEQNKANAQRGRPTIDFEALRGLEPRAAATQLLDGRFYVNIHTADYPNGAIRGQLSR